MLLRQVEYVKPETLDEAIVVLKQRPDAKCLAGGQSLVNVMKLRLASPGVVVDLNGLQELRTIRRERDALHIGAMATYRTIAENELIKTFLPIVAHVADHIGDRQVRNRGTIGGNCCFNDPTSNFPPLLNVLESTFVILGGNGLREVPAREFFLGTYRTAVQQTELLHSIKIPIPDGTWGASYLSFRVGNDGPAMLHVAAFVRLQGDRLVTCRIGIGGVKNAPYRPVELEHQMIGLIPSSTELDRLIRETLEVEGISDVHATSEYRAQMAKVYTRRALLEAIEDARRQSHDSDAG